MPSVVTTELLYNRNIYQDSLKDKDTFVLEINILTMLCVQIKQILYIEYRLSAFLGILLFSYNKKDI